MKVIVSNIQRFCLHDGPGIRTTVFFKGCNLSCPWCSNPENIKFNIENYIHDGINGQYGYEIELEALEREILKDKIYYETGGGVTFSGGEPLWQFKKIEPLLKSLKEKDINICVETALTVPEEYINIALKYVNEFYIDIKILDEKSIKEINGNVKLFRTNVDRVLKKNQNIIFRIPLIKEYTFTEENQKEIIEFIKNNKIKNIEVFKVHRLAENKYRSLNQKMKILTDNINENEINLFLNKLDNINCKCKMITI